MLWAGQQTGIRLTNNNRTASRNGVEGNMPRVYAPSLCCHGSDAEMVLVVDRIQDDTSAFSVGITPLESMGRDEFKQVGKSTDERDAIGLHIWNNHHTICQSGSVAQRIENSSCLIVGTKISVYWHASSRTCRFFMNDLAVGVPIFTTQMQAGACVFAASLSENAQLTLQEGRTSIPPVALEVSATRLRKLWTNRVFTDAEVRCGDLNWPVHRCILASASPVFAAMLESPCVEGRTASITITDSPSCTISELLEFLYTGQTTSLSNDLSSEAQTHALLQLMEHASIYDVKDLVRVCVEKFLAEPLDSACVVPIMRAIRGNPNMAHVHMAIRNKLATDECAYQAVLESV